MQDGDVQQLLRTSNRIAAILSPPGNYTNGQLVSAGGRVLGVTALGISLDQARDRAYAAVDRIELAGKQARRDIGARQMIS